MRTVWTLFEPAVERVGHTSFYFSESTDFFLPPPRRLCFSSALLCKITQHLLNEFARKPGRRKWFRSGKNLFNFGLDPDQGGIWDFFPNRMWQTQCARFLCGWKYGLVVQKREFMFSAAWLTHFPRLSCTTLCPLYRAVFKSQSYANQVDPGCSVWSTQQKINNKNKNNHLYIMLL